MTNKPTSICILGCGGFIGSHLVGRFVRDPSVHVFGIDLSCAKIAPYLASKNLTFAAIDVRDLARVREFVEQSDVVVSLAALCNPSLYNTVPLDVIDANFTQPLGVVRLCAELDKWLIHFSTCEVYGKTLSTYLPPSGGAEAPEHYVLSEGTTPFVLGPVSAQRWTYAAAKQLLERAIFAHAFEQGLRYTIVRPFNFIGPRMDFIPGIDGEGTPRVLACFMQALLSGQPLKLVDGGGSRRCFTYIDDAIDAVAAIIDKRDVAQGEIFNIGNPANETSIAGLAEKMIVLYRELRPEAADADRGVETVSSEQFYGEGYEDSDRRVPDISKARALLGWEPATGLDMALRETIAAYIREYAAEVATGRAC